MHLLPVLVNSDLGSAKGDKEVTWVLELCQGTIQIFLGSGDFLDIRLPMLEPGYSRNDIPGLS